MANEQFFEYRSDYAIPPGETLKETLEEYGITQSELAERMGRPAKTVSEIVNGRAEITAATALQLETVLGIPAKIWLNLERQYREDLARLEREEKLTAWVDWLKEIPIAAMAKAGWVEKTKDAGGKVRQALEFFGVASPEVWRELWLGATCAQYRRSPAFSAQPGAVAAWLRKGEIHAMKQTGPSFDLTLFRDALKAVRSLTTLPPEQFVPQLEKKCLRAGVVVLFVPPLPKVPVYGATRWISNRALIQLSLRGKTDSDLWFTFFHEAGHVLRHGRKNVFIESKNGLTGPEEDEANRFASDILIPPPTYKAFVQAYDFTIASVQRFAQQIGIAPGIVVGRLQHDKYVPWATRLNDLKIHYRWVDG